MESKLALEAKVALAAITRRMTPTQRLDAFLMHCQLLMELRLAYRQTQALHKPLPL
jgi:hypothetical protein